MKSDHEFCYEIYDGLPGRFNLVEYLFSNITDNELASVAFVCGDDSITYSELISNFKKFSGVLQSRGVKKGTRVAILLPDCLEFVYAYLAIIWLGGVAVIVNEAYSDPDILYIIDDSQVNLIVTRRKWLEKFEKNFECSIDWLLIDGPCFNTVLLSSYECKEPVLVLRESQAFWVYTSGSTGRPKGVIHSHYNPVVAIQTYGKHILHLSASDTVLSAPPMAFSYGLGTSLYFPLIARSKVILTSEVSPFEIIKLINVNAVTVFFGIPHNYASIYAVNDILGLRSQSLRLCVCAGEQLPITTWNNWKRTFGVSICEGIGTTESTHIFISNSDDDIVPGSTGRVVPGYRVRLIDDEGDEVEEGNEEGFLEVIGEGFTLGYWNKLKETQSLLRGQAMRTGDIYKVDANGNYFFLGRKDSLLKVKGMWVVPSEIEGVLMKHSSVFEAAVIIEPGTIEDTLVIVAYLRLRDTKTLNKPLKTQLNSLLEQYLPKYKRPKRIVAVDEFPRTATGKINRNKLIDSIGNQTVIGENI